MTDARLLKLIVEIRYADDIPEPFTFREKILSSISSEQVKTPKNIIYGFGMLIKKKNIKIVVENNRAGADIVVSKSVSKSVQYATENIIKVFKLMSKSVGVKRIERIGVRGYWIKNTDDTSDTLISKFKKAFFNKNSLVNESKDLNVILAFKDGDDKSLYNAAPLSKSELEKIINLNLKDYGHDNEEEITTNSAIYLDYDYFIEKKQTYNDTLMVNFINQAIKKSKERLTKTFELLK